MRDVARLAGVSTTTVSAVINATAPVSALSARKVREAMSALDYHPDALARGLRTGRTRIVGVIVPDITNTFYPEIVRGIEDAARKAGYGVLLSNSNEDAAIEHFHLNMLLSRRVDGVLMACCANSTAYPTLARHHLPTVFIDRVPAINTYPSVSSDNFGAGHLATRHLLDLGHQRIALIASHLGLSPQHDRLEGFRKAMQEVNLAIRDEYLICGEVQIEDGLRSCRQLLALESRPTAIMVNNAKLLLGVLHGLVEGGIRVPGEISVLCFDDPEWTRYSNPSMTAITHPTYDIGQRAFDLLEESLDPGRQETADHDRIQLATQLQIRGSTAPPGAKDANGEAV